MSKAHGCSIPSPAAARCSSRRCRAAPAKGWPWIPTAKRWPALRNHLDALKCGTAQLVLGDAVRYLGNQAPSAFDLVFLDPPFHQNLLQDACRLLETRGWLNPDAWIYTESESVPSSLGLPGNWRLHREKKAGNVHYALWQRGA